MARAEGLEITLIFETHRNEDLVSGAPILKAMTGARVLHGPNPGGEVVYAETAREGDEFAIGQLKIRVLETPGHTDDHLAFVLHDTAYPDGPVRSEEHTSELQSLMRISYAVFCLKKKNKNTTT